MTIVDDQISYSKSVPCAIKKYIQTSSHAQDLSRISIEERQLAFQHWVAYSLSGQSYLHLDGRFKCPLIACTNTEDTFESCLAHITSCTSLSNSWYWCPSCRKAEQFAEPIPALTSKPKPVVASRIVGFVTSSSPKNPGAKKTTGGFWKHVSNKLYFRSHPPRSNDNTMGKAELYDNSMDKRELTYSGNCDSLDDVPMTLAAEKDGLPIQHFALEGDQLTCEWFPPDRLTAELDSMHRSELHDNQPWTAWTPKYSELSADDPFQRTETSTSNDTTTPARPKSLVELSTPANDGHLGPGLDPNHSTYLAGTTHYDHPPPYQIKALGNPQESQETGDRQFTSTESTLALPGGLAYSMPSEMPTTMQEIQQPSLYFGLRRQRSRNTLLAADPPFRHSDRSEPQNSFQYTISLQNHEICRSPSYPWLSAPGYPLDDGSIGQVRTLWHRQFLASQSGQGKKTAVTKGVGEQVEGPNYSQDFHLVSPMGSPGPYSLPEHSHIVSPIGSPDFRRIIPGDQRGYRDALPTVGSNTETQELDEPYKCFSSSALNEAHRLEAMLRTSPTSSLAERYSLSSSSPLTSVASSHRDSTQSSNISVSTQATSIDNSLLLPSNQEPFEATVTSQGLNEGEISKCPECPPERPAIFHGKPQDRRSNLSRHLLYCHGERKKFPCPFDGCSMESSRPDNLLKHRRAVHQDVPLTRSNARRKKRNV